MKILFVASQNRHKNLNPIILNQYESLKSQGLDVELFGLKGRGFWGYIKNIVKLRKYVQHGDVNVIHAHYSFSGYVVALSGVRVAKVVSLMGSDLKSGRAQNLLIKIFGLFLWDRVIVKSNEMYELLRLKTAEVIPNGVDMEVFCPQNRDSIREYLGISKKSIVLGFFSNPKREEKNFALFEKVATELSRNYKVTTLVRYDLLRSEMPFFLNACDLLLLTSQWEGSPNIVKEAMACNIPVVATPVGDLESLFANLNNYIIASPNTGEFVVAVQKILNSPNLENTNEGRRSIYLHKLDSKSVAKKIRELYYNLCEEK